MEEQFRKVAHSISRLAGSVYVFFLAILIVVAWVITGPIFAYSNTWQLSINTLTTIVTFLMVFLIQNTQNRDSRAVHIKIDELLRAVKGTRPILLDIDKLSDDELEELQTQFVKISEKYESELRSRRKNKTERKMKTPGFVK